MSLMPIPFSFIRERVPLSWSDALWGYERQMIGWSAIVELARNRLTQESTIREIELACLDKSEAFRVGELLRDIVASESEKLDGGVARKWLFLMLAWIFENKGSISDPLGEVEAVYADFDYPCEIESFVRYMPVMSGYDPALHSKAENEQRLFDNWEKYINIRILEVQE